MTLEDGGTQTVDLSVYVSTDDQDLTGATLTGTDLQIDIENGGSANVDLSSLVDDADADPTNEYNTGIGFDGTNLTVTDAGGTQSVDISGVSTDDQALSLSGNTLTLEDGGNVDLSGFVSTDDQNISGSSLSGTNLIIGIENGTSETVNLASLVDDADSDITNELQTLSQSGTDVTLSDGGGTISVADNDNDSTNEYNTGIAFDGTNLTVTDGGGVQSVNISTVSTDDQALSLSGNTLTLEDGGSVNLAPYQDNTDAQTLSITGDQLSITNGNTVTVPTADGSETVVNGGGINVVSGSGTSGDPYVVTGTEVDGSVTNEIQDLDLTGNTLTITDNGSATAIDLSSYLDNTDDQEGTEVNLTVGLDSDGDGANETTVEESLSAITPITSGAARIFYPPSIAIDASTNGTGRTIDLYAQYIAQFENVPVRSPGAPIDIPTYAATDLYYYVTLADPAVFANMSIDANGVLTYDIIGQPSDYNSLINVVFVVR